MLSWLLLTVATSFATVIVAVPLVLRFEYARRVHGLVPAGPRDHSGEIEPGAAKDPAAAGPTAGPAETAEWRPTPDRGDLDVTPRISSTGRWMTAAATIALAVTAIYALSPGFVSNPAPFSNSSGGAPAAIATGTRMSDGDPKNTGGLASVEELTQRLAIRLQQNSRDLEGWRLLGMSYSNTGRHVDAAGAFAKAIELDPTNADLRAARVEALVKAAAGQVNQEAALAIEEGLRLAPENPHLRYFKGVVLQLAGDKRSAHAIWSEILQQDDPKEPWAEELRERLATVGRDLGLATPNQHLSTEPGSAAAMLEFLQSRERSAAGGRSSTAANAESTNSRDAAQPADNSAMVRAMVESLAARLEQSPNDVDGWLKLMRSRVVLGEQELARQAFARALQVSGDDPSKREKVTAAARQLGIR